MKKNSLYLLVSLTLLITLGVGCQTSTSYTYQGTYLEPPITVPDFDLLDTTGETFQLVDVSGDIVLVFFGYANCPDVCPLTLAEVKQVLTNLDKGQARIQLVFVSVDPERDTPDALSTYLAAFDQRFIGLTDSFEKVEIVMKGYGITASKDGAEMTEHGHSMDTTAMSNPVAYTVTHSGRLFLLNPAGEMILQYPLGFTAQALQSDLAHLINLYELE